MKTPIALLFSVAILSTLVCFPVRSVAESKAVSEQAGAKLFHEKGCAYCHGQALQGTQKGPALTNVRKTMKALQIANQIENGGQKMPPFGDALSNDEVKQLVAFLRAKHRPSPLAAPASAPDQRPSTNP